MYNIKKHYFLILVIMLFITGCGISTPPPQILNNNTNITLNHITANGGDFFGDVDFHFNQILNAGFNGTNVTIINNTFFICNNATYYINTTNNTIYYLNGSVDWENITNIPLIIYNVTNYTGEIIGTGNVLTINYSLVKISSFANDNGYINSVSSGNIDGLCNIDGKYLKRIGGTWQCADAAGGSGGSNTTFQFLSETDLFELKINNVTLMKYNLSGNMWIRGDVITNTALDESLTDVFNFYVGGILVGQLNASGDLSLKGDIITNEVLS